jgi:hypothetical protein
MELSMPRKKSPIEVKPGKDGFYDYTSTAKAFQFRVYKSRGTPKLGSATEKKAAINAYLRAKDNERVTGVPIKHPRKKRVPQPRPARMNSLDMGRPVLPTEARIMARRVTDQFSKRLYKFSDEVGGGYQEHPSSWSALAISFGRHFGGSGAEAMRWLCQHLFEVHGCKRMEPCRIEAKLKANAVKYGHAWKDEFASIVDQFEFEI